MGFELLMVLHIILAGVILVIFRFLNMGDIEKKQFVYLLHVLVLYLACRLFVLTYYVLINSVDNHGELGAILMGLACMMFPAIASYIAIFKYYVKRENIWPSIYFFIILFLILFVTILFLWK